jgi:Ca2+-binding EF-hand superfamily protein
MEADGANIAESFEEMETDKNGKMTINAFIRAITKDFPMLKPDDVLRLAGAIDAIDKDSMIDVKELDAALMMYSTSRKTFR